LSDDPPTVSVAGELGVNGSLLERYRNLIHLRQDHPALSTGTWTPVTSDASSVVASLRVAPTETALVVTNVSTDPVSPSLSLASGPLCGRPSVSGADGETIATAPTITASGGFDGYRPVAMLPPQSTLVILIGP
jgi:glycosidase